MNARKNLVIAILCLYAFLISLAFIFNDLNFWSKPVPGQISMIRLDLEELVYKGETRTDPIAYNNLLVYSIRINAISSSLNQAIKRSNLNLPPVKLFNSELSYKSQGRSWIAVSDNLILIFLYRDVSSILNANEVLAVAVHELGHTVLGHKSLGSTYHRNLKDEKNADKFAVDSGIDPNTLVSAISKFDEEFKTERVSALAQLQKS